MKRFFSVFFSILLILGLCPLNVSAENENPQPGDILGDVLYSDIVAYINEYPIPSCNVEGKTMVVAEDLRNYGFGVIWDDETRSLNIYPNMSTSFTPLPVEESTQPVGSFMTNYVYTNIQTFLSGELVESFAIDGMTLIDFELLAKYGGVYFNDETRELRLVITSYTTATPVQESTSVQPAEFDSDIVPDDYNIADYDPTNLRQSRNEVILNDDVLVISATDNSNVLISIDKEENQYTFGNIDSTLRNLTSGDKFVIYPCEAVRDGVSIIVSDINVNGDQAVIISSDVTLGDIVAVMDAAQIVPMTNDMIIEYGEGVTPVSAGSYTSAELSDIYSSAASLDAVGSIGSVSTSGSQSWQLEPLDINLKINDSMRVTGRIIVSPTLKADIYLDLFEGLKNSYFELSLDNRMLSTLKVEATYNGQIFDMASVARVQDGTLKTKYENYKMTKAKCEAYKAKLFESKFPIATAPGLQAVVIWYLNVTASGQISIEAVYTQQNSLGIKFQNNKWSPIFSNNTEVTISGAADASVYVSAGIDIGLSYIGIVTAALSPEVGLEIKASTEFNATLLDISTDAEEMSSADVHDCVLCVDGDINLKTNINANVDTNIFGNLLNKNLFNNSIKLGDFYFTFGGRTHGTDFAWTECPYKSSYPIVFSIKSLPKDAVEAYGLMSGRIALYNEDNHFAVADYDLNLLTDYRYERRYQRYVDGGNAIFTIGDDYVTVDENGIEKAMTKMPTEIYVSGNVITKMEGGYTSPTDTENISDYLSAMRVTLTVSGREVFNEECYLSKPFDGTHAYVEYIDNASKKYSIYKVDINGNKAFVFEYGYIQNTKYVGNRASLRGDRYIPYTPYLTDSAAKTSEVYIYDLVSGNSLTCGDSKYSKNGLFCCDQVINGYNLKESSEEFLNGGTFMFYADSTYLENRTKMLAHIEGNTVKIIKELTGYDSISYTYFGEQYILVSKGNKWGYIDKNGNEMKFYDDASDFIDGIALVKDGEYSYFIDTNFKQVSDVLIADGGYVIGVGVFGIIRDDVVKIVYTRRST